SVALPLRMVAVGTGAVVGVTLFVVGEGRYEPQNFPVFEVKTADLVWNWTEGRSNYTTLRDEAAAFEGGRAWEVVSSVDLLKTQITGQLSAGQGYAPVIENGTITKTPEQVHGEDMATLFDGMGSSTVRVTRLRADLARE